MGEHTGFLSACCCWQVNEKQLYEHADYFLTTVFWGFVFTSSERFGVNLLDRGLYLETVTSAHGPCGVCVCVMTLLAHAHRSDRVTDKSQRVCVIVACSFSCTHVSCGCAAAAAPRGSNLVVRSQRAASGGVTCVCVGASDVVSVTSVRAHGEVATH